MIKKIKKIEIEFKYSDEDLAEKEIRLNRLIQRSVAEAMAKKGHKGYAQKLLDEIERENDQ